MTYEIASRWFASLSGLEIVAFGACYLLYAFVGLILTHRWIDGLAKASGPSGTMDDADGCVILLVVLVAYVAGATVWPLTWGLAGLWRLAMLIARVVR